MTLSSPHDVERNVTSRKSGSDIGAVWKKELSGFTDGVSIVGLKYVFLEGASLVRKSIWLLLVLAGIAFMVYQLISRISYYISYPTSVTLEINHLPSVPFPTVTVCSENRMSKQALLRNDIYDVITQVFPLWYRKDLQLGDEDSAKLLNFLGNKSVIEAEQELMPAEFITMCFFNGAFCSPEHITSFYTSLGMCAQFNANGSLFVERAGSKYGLQLLMSTNQSDYGVLNSPAKGHRVLIHEHNEFPALDQHGIYAPVGNILALPTTIRNVTKLPEPYGRCENEPTYRRSVCLEECKASYVHSECGCALDYLPKHHLQFNRSCSFYDKAICLDKAMNEWYEEGLQSNCNCTQQCNQLYYENALHLADLSNAFADSIIGSFQFGISSQTFLDSNSQIYVYMSELTSEEIIAVPSYTILALLCDVGGALGLVLGSTILTLFEFTDFFITSVWTYLSYTNSHKKINVISASPA